MFMVDYMQRVRVTNITNETLEDLVLSHNGEGGHEISIKKLKANEEKEVSIYTLRVVEDCDLILNYSYNGHTVSVVAYDKLSVNDKRIIKIEIKAESGEIKINSSRENNLYD